MRCICHDDLPQNVISVTLSEEQLAVALAGARSTGLDGQVQFDLCDYRQVSGPFDRIVSIGMFEHVGVRYYDTHFANVRELPADDGTNAAPCHRAQRRTQFYKPLDRKVYLPGRLRARPERNSSGHRA